MISGRRIPAPVKRLLLDSLVLFVWVLAGITFGLPFTNTLAVGVGLIYTEGYPFPYETIQWVLGISVAVSVLSGL